MNQQRVMLSAVILMSLSLGASEAWAQRDEHRFGRSIRGHLKSLNLSQQQQQQISQMRSNMVTKTAPLRAQLEVKRAELRSLWLATTPNRGAIVAKHSEVDGLRRQLRNARIDFRLKVFSVLTPQQRSQLQTSLAARPQQGKRLSQRRRRAKARGFGGGGAGHQGF